MRAWISSAVFLLIYHQALAHVVEHVLRKLLHAFVGEVGLLFEMAAKYGTPYFSNYINSDMEPSDVRSMCCRLRLDLRELRKKSGGFLLAHVVEHVLRKLLHAFVGEVGFEPLDSSHLPVGYTEDVFSALDIQDELQTLYTSGTVFAQTFARVRR